MSLISAPVVFYYGANDILADPLVSTPVYVVTKVLYPPPHSLLTHRPPFYFFPQDVKLLYQKLPNPLGLRLIRYDKFNHVDFLWAKDLNKLLNDELVQFIKNSTSFFESDDFLLQTGATAREIRSKTPEPVDIPFNDANLVNKIHAGIPGLINIAESIPGVPETNIGEYHNLMKKKVMDGVQTVKKGEYNLISDGTRKRGRTLRTPSKNVVFFAFFQISL